MHVQVTFVTQYRGDQNERMNVDQSLRPPDGVAMVSCTPFPCLFRQGASVLCAARQGNTGEASGRAVAACVAPASVGVKAKQEVAEINSPATAGTTLFVPVCTCMQVRPLHTKSPGGQQKGKGQSPPILKGTRVSRGQGEKAVARSQGLSPALTPDGPAFALSRGVPPRLMCEPATDSARPHVRNVAVDLRKCSLRHMVWPWGWIFPWASLVLAPSCRGARAPHVFVSRREERRAASSSDASGRKAEKGNAAC